VSSWLASQPPRYAVPQSSTIGYRFPVPITPTKPSYSCSLPPICPSIVRPLALTLALRKTRRARSVPVLVPGNEDMNISAGGSGPKLSGSDKPDTGTIRMERCWCIRPPHNPYPVFIAPTTTVGRRRRAAERTLETMTSLLSHDLWP